MMYAIHLGLQMIKTIFAYKSLNSFTISMNITEITVTFHKG